LLEAAMGFDHYGLPEVFAGFPREEYGVPVHYPVACHPRPGPPARFRISWRPCWDWSRTRLSGGSIS
jgi:hypothetical protein